jgi:hypothetical protein
LESLLCRERNSRISKRRNKPQEFIIHHTQHGFEGSSEAAPQQRQGTDGGFGHGSAADGHEGRSGFGHSATAAAATAAAVGSPSTSADPRGYQVPQFRYGQPHPQARPAAAVGQQAPFVHRLTAPLAAAATRPTGAATPTPAAAAAVDPATRAANPYSFFAHGFRPPAPIFPQHQ